MEKSINRFAYRYVIKRKTPCIIYYEDLSDQQNRVVISIMKHMCAVYPNVLCYKVNYDQSRFVNTNLKSYNSYDVLSFKNGKLKAKVSVFSTSDLHNLFMTVYNDSYLNSIKYLYTILHNQKGMGKDIFHDSYFIPKPSYNINYKHEHINSINVTKNKQHEIPQSTVSNQNKDIYPISNEKIFKYHTKKVKYSNNHNYDINSSIKNVNKRHFPKYQNTNKYFSPLHESDVLYKNTYNKYYESRHLLPHFEPEINLSTHQNITIVENETILNRYRTVDKIINPENQDMTNLARLNTNNTYVNIYKDDFSNNFQNATNSKPLTCSNKSDTRQTLRISFDEHCDNEKFNIPHNKLENSQNMEATDTIKLKCDHKHNYDTINHCKIIKDIKLIRSNNVLDDIICTYENDKEVCSNY